MTIEVTVRFSYICTSNLIGPILKTQINYSTFSIWLLKSMKVRSPRRIVIKKQVPGQQEKYQHV